MPFLDIAGGKLHYDVQGDGYPVLLFAPGFLSSRIERWRTNPARPGVPQDWLDPIAASCPDRSGRSHWTCATRASRARSFAPATTGRRTRQTILHCSIISASRDVHVMGACIGVSFAYALAAARPELVSALVLQNPIGLSSVNRQALDQEFDKWAAEVRGWPGVEERNMPGFRQRMFGGDFIFSVSREFVARCTIPALLMPGDDLVHPAEVSADIARAPQVEVLATMERRGAARRRDAPRRRIPGATHGGNAVTKIAVLDDWQRVARSAADWSPLTARADVTFFTEPFAGEDDAARQLAPFDILLVTRERTPFPNSLWSRLPNLKMFGLTGARAGLIDMAGMIAGGITVCYTGGGPSAHSTAEIALGLLLSLARRIPAADAAVRAGRFQLGTEAGPVLAGKTLGLVGLGRIGTLMAAYGNALAMKVVAWSPNLTDERAAAAGATRLAKDALLRASDAVSLHLVLSPRTRGVLGAGRSCGDEARCDADQHVARAARRRDSADRRRGVGTPARRPRRVLSGAAAGRSSVHPRAERRADAASRLQRDRGVRRVLPRMHRERVGVSRRQADPRADSA